jgi:hypothetical protein
MLPSQPAVKALVSIRRRSLELARLLQWPK